MIYLLKKPEKIPSGTWGYLQLIVPPVHGLRQGVLVRLIVFNLPSRSVLWARLNSSMTLALGRDFRGAALPCLVRVCVLVNRTAQGLRGGSCWPLFHRQLCTCFSPVL